MSLIARGLFVVGGIAIGSFLINHFVFGNTGDALPKSPRMGADQVKSGRLSRAALGLSSPENLRPLLAQHADAADTCPPPMRQAAKS